MNATLSLADLVAFDPRGGKGRAERRFCCPLCHAGRPLDATHRSLSLRQDGVWLCHRCHASGILAEQRAERPRRASDRARAREAFRVENVRTQPTRNPVEPSLSALDVSVRVRTYDFSAELARCEPIPGTPAEAYLASRGIQPDPYADEPWFSASLLSRACVVFPLRLPDGQLAGLCGRSLEGKWMRTLKSGEERGVFASLNAWEADEITLTEAPIDALSLAELGRPAIALVGTSFPDWLPAQLAFRRVVLAHDADEAGDRAAAALHAALAPLGTTCYRLRPPAGSKDWNEFLGKGLRVRAHRNG